MALSLRSGGHRVKEQPAAAACVCVGGVGGGLLSVKFNQCCPRFDQNMCSGPGETLM